jgi:hypothetical protein
LYDIQCILYGREKTLTLTRGRAHGTNQKKPDKTGEKGKALEFVLFLAVYLRSFFKRGRIMIKMNGMELLAESELIEEPGKLDSFVVLRLKECKDGRVEYITHVWTPVNDAFFWGHYFTDYTSAINDFNERCDNYGVGAIFRKNAIGDHVGEPII